jgi:hypothetical protein
MDVLFKCFVVGLVAGIPIWILIQIIRPRVAISGLPVFSGSGPSTTRLRPIALHGRFVTNVAKRSSS